MAQPAQPTGTQGARTPQPAPVDHAAHAKLDARRGDVQCLVGLPSGRYTVAAAPLWLGVAAVMTVVVALVLVVAAPKSYLLEMMNRCWTNWAVVFFSCWCLGIMYAKWTKTSIQMRALRAVDIVPRRGDFVLSPGTAGDVLRRIRASGRTTPVLMLTNLGEVRDVGAVLESQADSDASSVDSSYTVIRSLIWTIPILGFIGTVVGLSQAIGSFTDVLNQAGGDSSSIKSKLGPVVAGLATAFETTLVALLAAVVIQLLSTWVYKREEALLDGITDFTNEHVLSRLKLTDWQ